MDVSFTRTSLGEVIEDVLIVPVFEGETPLDSQASPALAALDHLSSGALERLAEHGELSGKLYSWSLLHNAGQLSPRVLFIGAGKRESLSSRGLQRISGAAVRALSSRGVRSAAVLLRNAMTDEASVKAVIEGAILGQVTGDIYRTSDKEETKEISSLHLISESPDVPDLAKAIETASVMAEATNFARRLGFEPGNVMTPSELARQAQEMAARERLFCEVLGEQEMKELGMGALLGVARGSEEPARLIVLGYNLPEAGEAGELIALVGKGITFDSGGISIKPAEGMDEMKYDMGGGAAVIGAMQAIARLKPRARVLGVVPATENLPSGRAIKPGDVVRTLSGKTVEVANTDAEGRLILSDAITYSINRGATTVVDIATLTGACVIALGEVRAAVMSPNQELVDELIKAGDDCGERLWQLPLDKEYGELIHSDIADIRNIGNRTSGAITAGYFIKHFAGSVDWAHLDVAGTAWLEQAKPYMAKGATGFGVRLLASFVLNRAGGE
jgi:leucyl aminopeptidase